MKFESKDLIYIALLIAAGYLIFNLNSELSGANRSIKTMNVELEDQKASNMKAYKDLEKKINSQVNLTKKLQLDVTSLDASKKIIYIKTNEERTRINSITSADSLASIISRRYR